MFNDCSVNFHDHSNVLNHIKVIFLCSVVHCFVLQISPRQEKGTRLHFWIAFSIDRSRNCACFTSSDIYFLKTKVCLTQN